MRTRAEIQAEMDQLMRDAGMIRLTVSRNGQTRTEWMEARIEQPDPGPDTRKYRTSANPGQPQWAAQDKATKYRTGCAWHTCPRCTTYHTVERTKQTSREPDGTLTTQWVERRRPTELMPNGDRKPATGTNLYRWHSDGHEECADCGWKGEPRAATKRREPIDKAWKRRILTAAIERAKLVKGPTG